MKRAAFPLFIALLLVSAVRPQTATPVKKTADAVPAPTPASKHANSFQRWFDFDTISLQLRYRHVGTDSSIGRINQAQWQVLLKGHFQFDAKAKYRVNWTVNTGPVFTAGWNNTGWGTGLHQTNLYVKHIYFDAKPTKKLEFQVGGIEFNRGDTTEVIGYDNDGYMTGERVSVRAPRSLFFDEISATAGYVGDVAHPSVFYRFKRHLDNFDYHQFLVRKQVTRSVSWTAEYSFLDGRDTLREAVKIKSPKALFFDTLLFESYQRLDPQRDAGFHAFAEKIVNKRLTLSGGFARIDRRVTLNADRFPPGHRLYIGSVIKLSPVFTLNPVFIHAVGDLPTQVTPRTRLDVIFTYNLLEDLKRHHVL